MAQPVAYTPVTSFLTYQATQSWFPGQNIDVELNNLKTTTDQIRTNLALIQRDDGALVNGIVTYDTLSPALQSAGLAPLSAWVTGTTYSKTRIVVQNYALYECVVAHTSGIFATDLNAGLWVLLTALPQGAATVSIGTTTTGAAGTSAAVTNSGSSTVAVLNFTIPRGNTGAQGDPGSTGAAAWKPVVGWVTSTAYVVGPPASVVVENGETYVCLIAHTSGTFATDLAAGKWIKIAAKADGAGIFRVENYATFGLTGDGVGPITVSITNASAVLTRASGNWSSADVGKLIVVASAGAAGAALCTTIASFNPAAPTQVTLGHVASSTASGANCWYGTDWTSYFNAAWADARVAGGTVTVGSGTFCFTRLSFHNAIGVSFEGAGKQSGAGPTDYGTHLWCLADLNSSDGNAIDASGNTHVAFKNFQLHRGDITNFINVGILVAAKSGQESIFYTFEDVQISGFYLVAGIYQLGVPHCSYHRVISYTYANASGAYGAQFTCVNHASVTSANNTLNAGPLDTSNVLLEQCHFIEQGNLAGHANCRGARLNGVDVWIADSCFFGSTNVCLDINDTSTNFGSRNVILRGCTLQGFQTGVGTFAAPNYAIEVRSTEQINNVNIVDCRCTEAASLHNATDAQPGTSFLQLSAATPLKNLTIKGPPTLSVALINGYGSSTAILSEGWYVECNGAAIQEHGSVHPSCIYVDPGTIIAQTGARSEAETFPLKINPQSSFSFNLSGRLWGAGTSAAPNGWTLAGTSATVAQNTTAGQFRAAEAGAALTRSGTDCTLQQIVTNIARWSNVAAFQGRTVTFGRWVYATAASRARISIYDGVTRTYSSYHTGNSTLQFLTVTATLNAAATAIIIESWVDTGNTTAVFSGGAFVLGAGLKSVIAAPQEWQGRSTVFALSSVSNVNANSTVSVGLGTNVPAFPIPFPGVLRQLRAYSSGTAAGAGQSYTYTVRQNGGATTLTTSISGASATTASDLTHHITLAGGDTIDILLVTSTTAAVTGHGIGIGYEETPL